MELQTARFKLQEEIGRNSRKMRNIARKFKKIRSEEMQEDEKKN